MSNITDFILIGSLALDDHPGVFQYLNTRMQPRISKVDLEECRPGYAMQQVVWIGCGNYMDASAFVDLVLGAPWVDDDMTSVTLLFQYEHEDGHRLVMFHGQLMPGWREEEVQEVTAQSLPVVIETRYGPDCGDTSRSPTRSPDWLKPGSASP